MTVLAVALDLGSTRIKSGVLDATTGLVDVQAVGAPALSGTGLVRECDAAEYFETASALLAQTLDRLPTDIPVGIASQRSSFLLWRADTGDPVTPMISWQDRRALEWCETHVHYNDKLVRQTGLLLSPHYAGPKLAHLMAVDETLSRAADAGELRFGTLETYFLWRSTGRRVHVTDLTMAARTLLADPRASVWSQQWLKAFGVSPTLLPSIVSTRGRREVLDGGGVVTASVTDQAASVLALDGTRRGVLVNLGTGGFVTIRTGETMTFVDGYLSGPLLAEPDGVVQYGVEGTINGIGTTLANAPRATLETTMEDAVPGVFCSAESAGLGAPFWRADLPFALSQPEANLSAAEHRRVIIEGIVFRVAGITRALCGPRLSDPVVLSGGLASDRFLVQALCNCLQHPVEVSKETESTLLGAARLASGTVGEVGRAHGTVVLPESRSYLPQKFLQWEEWMKTLLAGA